MKKRTTAHVIDSAGEDILRKSFPNEWVVRPYRPDYGIDFAVEVFDDIGEFGIAMGDHFFVQLKSHARGRWITKRVHPRRNVEKGPLAPDHTESTDIRVHSEAVETSELQLARAMGPAAPLLLVVADLEKSAAHWVCLNDFVDKILIPEVGDIAGQDEHTVHVPAANCIERCESALSPLRFTARRAKLYGAFNRFRYQRHEIGFALEAAEISDQHDGVEAELLQLADHFLDTVLAYDFWKTTQWEAIKSVHVQAEMTANRIRQLTGGKTLPQTNDRLGDGQTVRRDIRSTFEALANLGDLFEEICREWFLPTYMSALMKG